MTLQDKWELVITAWTARVVVEGEKHGRLAIQCKRWHYALGIPAASLAAISGASVLIEMAMTNLVTKILVGMSGLLVSILTGIQTFAQLSGTAERHRITSVRCKSLIRELEMQKLYPPKKREEAENRMEQLHEAFSDMEKDAPITMAMLREPPKDESLKDGLEAMAAASDKITNLGFSLWSFADASVGGNEDAEQDM